MRRHSEDGDGGTEEEEEEGGEERRIKLELLGTHSDLGLLDLLDLPLGRRNGAGGLRGETGRIVKTLLSVKAGFHHHPSHLLLLLYSGKASLSPLLSLSSPPRTVAAFSLTSYGVSGEESRCKGRGGGV